MQLVNAGQQVVRALSHRFRLVDSIGDDQCTRLAKLHSGPPFLFPSPLLLPFMSTESDSLEFSSVLAFFAFLFHPDLV